MQWKAKYQQAQIKFQSVSIQLVVEDLFYIDNWIIHGAADQMFGWFAVRWVWNKDKTDFSWGCAGAEFGRKKYQVMTYLSVSRQSKYERVVKLTKPSVA